MKKLYPFIIVVIFIHATLHAQSDNTKRIKAYAARVHTINGETEKGILYRVNNDTLELLPSFMIIKSSPDSALKMKESSIMTFLVEQVQYVKIYRKQTTGVAVGTGIGAGVLAGAIIGAAITPKSECTSNYCLLPDNWEKRGRCHCWFVYRYRSWWPYRIFIR
jgi:hypothetical protein